MKSIVHRLVKQSSAQPAATPVSYEAFKLRFFRDLSAAARFEMLQVFGVVPDAVKADDLTHITEARLLKLAVNSLTIGAPAPAASPVAEQPGPDANGCCGKIVADFCEGCPYIDGVTAEHRAKLAAAPLVQSPAVPEGAQAGGVPTREREFTNELGNRIKITIEGPTSTSENILTPMEARELCAALAATPPAQEQVQAEPPSNLPASLWLNDMGTEQKLSFTPLNGAFEHHEYHPAAPAVTAVAQPTDSFLKSLSASFCTSFSDGSEGVYELRFGFLNLKELQAAHRAWSERTPSSRQGEKL